MKQFPSVQPLTASPTLRDRTTFHDFHEPSRENPRHHSRSAITQLAGILFFAPGETLSRMGSSTIFQRSYSKTRTVFTNFRFSRFVPHPPPLLLLVSAIEIKSASITPVSLLKNDEVTLLFSFFLFFAFFPFPHNKSTSGIFIETAFETVTSFEIDFCKLSAANLYTLRLRVCACVS